MTRTLSSHETLEQILAEIKSVASRVDHIDSSVSAFLDLNDGALKEKKVASVEGCLSALSNLEIELVKRMDEAEERVSTAEDSHGAYGTSIAAMERSMEQLKLKFEDLENCGRRKNLRIINFPEKAEGNPSLAGCL